MRRVEIPEVCGNRQHAGQREHRTICEGEEVGLALTCEVNATGEVDVADFVGKS